MDITGKVDIVHENHESAMLVMVPTISPEITQNKFIWRKTVSIISCSHHLLCCDNIVCTILDQNGLCDLFEDNYHHD